MRRLFFLVLLMVASACTLSAEELPPLTPNEQNVIFVTATPDSATGTAIAQAPTQPPTFTPTPLPDPNVLMQLADSYLLNGYFENAVANYQLILDQGDYAPDNLRALAAYKLGQSALREGLFAESLQALHILIEQFPNDPTVGQAYFLRGDANLGLSRWNEAIADFQQYLALRPSLVDSYAYERIADAQIALGQIDTAFGTYNLALNAERTLVPQLILREKVAQILISVGRYGDAVAQYDAILGVAQNAPYRASIDFEAAKTILLSGDTSVGLQRMRNITLNYANTPTAYLAMQSLLDNEIEVDNFERGKISYNYGDYQGAIDAFNIYSSTHQLTAVPAELHLLLGRAYREIGNPSAAVVAFQTIIDQYPDSPLFGDALLEQGRTKFLSGDIPGAISTYLNIADTYGYLEATAADALWRAGYLYGTNAEPTLSRQTFVRLADSYPNQELTTNGLFLAASAAVTNEEWAVAENLYGRLAVLSTGEDQSAAYLWVARLALQRGDSVGAEEALNLAVSSAPDSYFAARASDIWQGIEPFQPPTQFNFSFDDVTQIAEAETWLRQTFGITQEGSLWQLSSTLENDPRMIRGRELWAVGAFDEAIDEFDSLIDEVRDNRDALSAYQLTIYLRGIGSYLPSIVAAADVIRMGNVSTLQAPPFIARMRYPAYYLDVVQEVTGGYGIDPLLMFSLIRHESLFNTNATAAAGEKGLTQVIPSTAQYIAEQIQWQDYQHSDLFRPYAGVSFGAFYLDEQLNRFDGNTIAALGAYNAGPGRAIDWLALSGGDPDLFMTAITIDSTRLYIQRIYGYYNIYRVLYGI